MSEALQNKLQQYAPQPPEGVWNRIASSLDEEPAALGARLQAYEEAPPAHTWAAIARRLGSAPLKQVSTQTIIRYAAAAVCIGLVVFGGLRFFAKGPAEAGLITHEARTPAGTASPEPAERKATDAPIREPDGITASRTTKGSPHTPRGRNGDRIAAGTSLAARGLMENFIPQTAEPKPVIAARPTVEKYMVYSDDLGNAVKLPKKLFDFFACVAEDISCKKQMQHLQQKFAATGFTTDFTGVMEMLQGLKENQ